MMSKRKFYEHAISFIVLSEESHIGNDLRAIIDGAETGDLSRSDHAHTIREVDAVEIAKLLIAQGSDPEFFGVNENGEEIEREEDD